MSISVCTGSVSLSVRVTSDVCLVSVSVSVVVGGSLDVSDGRSVKCNCRESCSGGASDLAVDKSSTSVVAALSGTAGVSLVRSASSASVCDVATAGGVTVRYCSTVLSCGELMGTLKVIIVV